MRISVTCLALAISISTANAQLEMKSIEKNLGLVVGGSVVIANEGNMPINFTVRPMGGAWSTYTVGSGENTSIRCDNCDSGTYEIEVRTDNRRVAYALQPLSRYVIRWNDNAKLWDIYLASGRE